MSPPKIALLNAYQVCKGCSRPFRPMHDDDRCLKCYGPWIMREADFIEAANADGRFPRRCANPKCLMGASDRANYCSQPCQAVVSRIRARHADNLGIPRRPRLAPVIHKPAIDASRKKPQRDPLPHLPPRPVCPHCWRSGTTIHGQPDHAPGCPAIDPFHR